MRKVLLLAFLLCSLSYGHAQNQYTWILASGDLDEPGNWSPMRYNPLPDDILIFDGSNSSIVYITNFSPREVIGQMVFLNNCSAIFQTSSSTPGPGTVSWSGTTLTGVGTSFLSDFVPGDLININGTVVEVATVTSSNRITTTNTGGSIPAGTSYMEYARLTMTGGTNAFYVDNSSSVTVNASSPISFYMAAGSTGDIEGALDFSVNQHRLNSASAAAFTFGSTGKFTQSNGFIGNAFTAAGVPNAVTFTSGSTCTVSAGLNPFALLAPASKVVFQTGSLFKQTSGAPVFDGRKYGNFELSVNGSTTVTGSNAASVDNIVLSGTSTTFNWGLTGSPGHVIKGNITVGTGCTFNFFSISNTVPSTVTFGGSSLQTISTPGAISPITINSNATIINGNPAGMALAPGTTIKAQGNSITFNLNNNPLILKSTVNGTAGIGSFDGNLSNYLLNATNVTVERYIPAHAARGYTLVTSPLNSPTIRESWQEAGAAIVGYGTQISGSGTGNGFDFASASGTSSIFTYNDANVTGSKWVSLANTNSTTLGTGTGYLLFVRGDRTVGAGSAAPQATTLRARGSLAVGYVTFATNGGTPGTLNLTRGANKYNLIANPFACAIAWSTASVTTDNLSTSYTVYDANLKVFVTSDGITKSPNIGQQQANIIQSGQAFFIQNDASGNDPAFTIKESDKVTSFSTRTANTVFRTANSTAQLNMNIYHGTVAQPTDFADGAVAIFGSAYSAGVGKEDASKFTNFNETIGWNRDGKILSIEGRPLTATNDTLYCNMQSMKQENYNFSIDATGFTNTTTATLIDRYTGTRQQLDLTQLNSYDFTVNADAGSSAADRFMIVLGSNIQLIATSAVQVKLGPNPFNNQLTVSFSIPGTAAKTIRLLNTLGQVVKTQAIGSRDETGTVTVHTGHLLPGAYIVEVWGGGNKVFTQQIVKQ